MLASSLTASVFSVHPSGTHVRASRRASGLVRASAPINPDIKKDNPKVVDEVVASAMEKPMVAYCRCWRSKTFPQCDGKLVCTCALTAVRTVFYEIFQLRVLMSNASGSHVAHNKEAGDNVGPLLVKK